MKRSRGFSLIELMVAMIVLALLLGVAVPGMQDIIRRNRISSEVNRVVSDLLLARNSAITRGAVVTICRSGDQATCLSGSAAGQYDAGWMTYAAPNPNVAYVNNPALGFELLKVGDPSTGLMRIRSNGAQAPDYISFLPSGRVSPSAPGNIVISFCHDGVSTATVRGRRLSISVSGRPTLSDIPIGNCP